MAYFSYETKRVERFITQFKEKSTYDKSEWNEEWPYTFTAAMISSCEPIFDACESNHEVEDLLRKKKIIRTGKGCMTDSESCQMFVCFKRKDGVNSFIKRLNKYLMEEGRKKGLRTHEEAREEERKAS
jgi:hypothetical protein